MSFEEPEDRLMSHMKSFGWDIEPFVKKGTLKIKRFDALDIARSVEALLSAAKKELLIDVEPMFFPEDFEPETVMVDSLTSIASAFSGEENRFRIYMEQLFRYLESKQITSFLIREVPIPTHMGNVMWGRAEEAVSFLSDGIIAIYNVIHDNGKRESAIEVIKMRGTHINKKIVSMTITDKGLTIYPGKILEGIHTQVKLT
jgi:KaiC/GvpD/RAD55 family RecA-like ATPase